ncbi:AAA family ATPase [Streptomyces sp. NPDC047097]|uniref:helix-turn-helix transcriptional regulator n=1 Tax=Streptomyces sp. NPDC047097 TaxID=3155260 RepID=UPI0033D565CA
MAGSILLEREYEIDVLSRRMTSALNGLGSLILIEGEAGVGKTRLLEEARALARAGGARTLTAYGSEMERDFAFGLVRQLLEPALVSAPAELRADWFSGAARAARPVVDGKQGSQTSSGDFAVLHGLYWCVANMASTQPLALLIDDAQWADAPSLRFLMFLVHRLSDIPVAVVVASRPGADAATARSLDVLGVDAATTRIRPRPLSLDSSGLLLNEAFRDERPAEVPFIEACHDVTGGNPLLLEQLARVMRAEGIEPVRENIGRVVDLGPQAVSRYVAGRLAELPEAAHRLARAVAVLGDGVRPDVAARQAGLSPEDTVQAAQHLTLVDIFSMESVARGNPLEMRLKFTHPLVRATVYGTLDPDVLMSAHIRAVQVLEATGAEAEKVGAHLLSIPPAGSERAVTVLRRAADDALLRGSPDAAQVHLMRALAEPPPREQRLDVLLQLAHCGQLLNDDRAIGPLREALTLSASPHQRAMIRAQIGSALFFLSRTTEALQIQRQGMREAPDENTRGLLAAGMLSTLAFEPNQPALFAYTDELERLPPHDSAGAGARDSMIAMVRTWQGRPEGIARARRAGRNEAFMAMPSNELFLALGVWHTLITADDEEAQASLENAIADAHRDGSVRALTAAFNHRGWGRLHHGHLDDAEADLLSAMRAVEEANVHVGRAFNGAFRAELHIARGRYAEAQAALEWGRLAPGNPGAVYHLLMSQARLLRLRGQADRALQTALQAGRSFASCGGDNPALIPWRSEAAVNLHRLGRVDEARQYAEQELVSARRWGAPRALGRALRVVGLAYGGTPKGLAALEESWTVLSASSARIEQIDSGLAYGAALWRATGEVSAQEVLREAITLAHACGSAHLVRVGIDALKKTGARPRRPTVSGPDSLTPSEARVARLAASGASNREIAQELFVSVKTVEVHLTNSYRKLGVRQRAELQEILAD